MIVVLSNLFIFIGEIFICVLMIYLMQSVVSLKYHINSRMDQIVRLSEDIARAAGKVEGIREERERMKE